jgi:hypothetical protein
VRKIPIVIDFGLSLDINKVLHAFAGEKTNIALLRNYFFTSYPAYYIWPIEVHYICYLLNVNNTPSEKDIERLCDEYLNGNETLNTIYSASFTNKFRMECIKSLKPYIGEKYTDVIKRIIEQSYKTWDNYGLSMLMMSMLYLLNFNGFGENRLISELSQLLLMNIHPNFKKRLSIDDSINNFNVIIYRTGIIQDSNFSKLVNNINLNVSEFINKLRLNTRSIKQLSANLSSH